MEYRVDQKQYFEDVDITLDVHEKPKVGLVVRLISHKHEIEEILGEIYVPSEPNLMIQVNYLKMIQEIAQIRNFQYLIATHSPQIFDNQWSLTTDLYTNSLEQE